MQLLSFLSCLLAAAGTHAQVVDPNSELVQEALESLNINVLPTANVNSDARASTTLATKASVAPKIAAAAVTDPAYWLKDIKKQGLAAFNSDPSGYKVWRNVKDYGAKGDGVTDDSAAINAAISDGNRCAPWTCQSSTTSPAEIYFPAGTYLIGSKINVYYFTQLIGNPNNRAVLKAASTLEALALIDAAPYRDSDGASAWTHTNIFLRQIRNLVIDLTARDPTKGAQGIHWPTSQATSIQNVKIIMTKASNSVHAGIFVEDGSGGFMSDLEISGGLYGLNIGNQQFTMRNIKISDAVIGISQIWNWGWLYQGLTISNCGTAFSMINGLTNNQLVGSVVIIDSDVSNTDTFVDMAWTTTATPKGAGQLILENINLSNVPIAVKGSNKTVLAGGTTTIAAWGQGNKYTPNGPTKFQGAITPAIRPAGLLNGNKYWTVSKPQYESITVDNFISARSSGAKGDGTTDDTTAIQNAINTAVAQKKILFFDHGVYKVTNTIYVPPGSRLVGETYSVIMASGSTWSDITQSAIPVVQIGKSGESGSIEWSDMVVSTQGATPRAKLIEYNLNTSKGSGIWDVHTRVGGSKGTNLQVAQCPKGSVNTACYAAHTNVHITKTAVNAYFENNWFWTADHDLDDASSTQISVFTGRGMLVEGSNHWLWGGGVEHHGIYQYQFSSAKNIFAGYIQTETPYWQPSPDAKSQPYPIDTTTLRDPDYKTACPSGVCDSWALRILDSQSVHIYAAGLYSFYKNYDVTCSNPNAANGQRDCQNEIFSTEGTSSDIIIYTLNEVGALQMVTIDKVDKASWSDNLSVYSNTIGLFTYKV